MFQIWKKSKHGKVIFMRLKYICNFVRRWRKCEENRAIFQNKYPEQLVETGNCYLMWDWNIEHSANQCWWCRFVLEIRQRDGEWYPHALLYQLCCGIVPTPVWAGLGLLWLSTMNVITRCLSDHKFLTG